MPELSCRVMILLGPLDLPFGLQLWRIVRLPVPAVAEIVPGEGLEVAAVG